MGEGVGKSIKMAILGQEQTIFKKVALSEKKMLFREVAKEKIQIVVKSLESDETFHLIAVQTERDEALLCHHTADSKDLIKDQKVISSFTFHDERYYFHTDLIFQNGWSILKINVDLFQLQRRASARIELPDNYDGIFVLAQHAGKPYFIDCRIKDISAGGLRLELLGDSPALKVGDRMKGTLKLGKRRPIDFEVEVRFAKKINEDGKVVQTGGVQFLNRDHTIENRLLLMMMDLQRELYLKYSD